MVIIDGAAVHRKCATAMRAYTTTAVVRPGIFLIVIADGAAIHFKSAVVYLHTCTTRPPALRIGMIAADRSTVHVKCGGRVALRANPHSFSFCTGRVSDRATAFAVTKYELRIIGDIDDLAVRIGGACYGACQAVSIQTEIERAACFYYKVIVSCRITRQIDIGGISIRIVCNLVCSIPRGPCDSVTRARVVADISMRRTTDRVVVVPRIIRQCRCRQHPHHKTGCNRDR